MGRSRRQGSAAVKKLSASKKKEQGRAQSSDPRAPKGLALKQIKPPRSQSNPAPPQKYEKPKDKLVRRFRPGYRALQDIRKY